MTNKKAILGRPRFRSYIKFTKLNWGIGGISFLFTVIPILLGKPSPLVAWLIVIGVLALNILVILYFAVRELWFDYKTLKIERNNIASISDRMAEITGYLRKELTLNYKVNTDGSIDDHKEYTIESFTDLSEIVLTYYQYPGIENQEEKVVKGDFMASYKITTPDGSNVVPVPIKHQTKRRTAYHLKFNPTLPKGSTIELTTTKIKHPPEALKPEAHYIEAVKEGGNALTYMSLFPTRKVVTNIELPTNKEILALDYCKNSYKAVTYFHSENIVENSKEWATIKSKKTTASHLKSDNVFELTIDNPRSFFEYNFFWKYATKED